MSLRSRITRLERQPAPTVPTGDSGDGLLEVATDAELEEIIRLSVAAERGLSPEQQARAERLDATLLQRWNAAGCPPPRVWSKEPTAEELTALINEVCAEGATP